MDEEDLEDGTESVDTLSRYCIAQAIYIDEVYFICFLIINL